MKIELRDAQRCWQIMKVSIPDEEARKGFNKLLRKYRTQVTVPGFRKGKAPLSIIERRFGEMIKEEFILEEAKAILQKAIEEKDVKLASQADIESTSWEKDSDLIIEFKYEVLPEINVDNYEGLQLEIVEEKLEEDAVDKTIENMQQNIATQEEVDGPAENGFIVTADFTADTDKEKPLKFSRTFTIGDNIYNTQINEAIIGKKVGDEFLSTIFDKKAENLKKSEEKYRGKEFQIQIKALKKKVLPEIDDEFAKDMDFDSLEEMKTKIEENLKLEIERANHNKTIETLHQKLIEANPFDLPEAMIEEQAQNLANDFATQYKFNAKEAVPMFKPMAEQQLKIFQITKKLIEKLNIEVTEEDEEALIKEAADNMNMDVEKYKELYKKELEKDSFSYTIKERKLHKYLLEKSVIIKKEKEDKAPEESSGIGE